MSGSRGPGPGRGPAGRRPRARVGTALVVPAVAALALLFLGLPVAVLVARALVAGLPEPGPLLAAVLEALGLSLVTSTASTLLVVTLGTPLAWVLARRRIPGRSVVEGIVDLPVVLPPAVAGLALLLVLGRRGVLGGPLAELGIAIPFTTIAVVVAQAFVAAPFYVRSARSGFAGVDPELEDAARVDGAAEGQVLRAITLPLASAALGGGLVLAWARALGEFGATIMFAGSLAGETRTLPLLVYAEFQAGELGASISAAAILVLAALAVLVAVRLLRRVTDRGGADPA